MSNGFASIVGLVYVEKHDREFFSRVEFNDAHWPSHRGRQRVRRNSRSYSHTYLCEYDHWTPYLGHSNTFRLMGHSYTH
jgi:hypothetical protein